MPYPKGMPGGLLGLRQATAGVTAHPWESEKLLSKILSTFVPFLLSLVGLLHGGEFQPFRVPISPKLTTVEESGAGQDKEGLGGAW